MSDEELVGFLEEMSRVHFRDEEQILYPAMRGFFPTSELNAYEQAHREVAERLAAARTVLEEGRPVSDRLSRIVDDVKAHARSEEEALFPAAEGKLGAERLAELQRRRQQFARATSGG